MSEIARIAFAMGLSESFADAVAEYVSLQPDADGIVSAMSESVFCSGGDGFDTFDSIEG
ncbi:MAG: hypothetical protein QJR02_01445 [Sinobacteraceae bacterium]|nr:hypothetical protein [Nevskiaceae bacterium]